MTSALERGKRVLFHHRVAVGRRVFPEIVGQDSPAAAGSDEQQENENERVSETPGL
jgi:hypothetical protein